jgi:hypothetical protein
LYLPNCTEEIIYDTFSSARYNLSMPLTNWNYYNTPNYFISIFSIKLFPTRNCVGKLFAANSTSGFQEIVDLNLKSKIIISLLRARVEILKFQKKFGFWPTRIDDVVPFCEIKNIIDPCDGRLIRYDPKKILYSIGVDGKDMGGSVKICWIDALNDVDEPTLRLQNFD